MKEMMKKVKERREGFTMAELLIVVAIIAVLVAIAIPVFTSQLEKSKEATDLANIRAAYAQASAAAVAEDKTAAGVTVTSDGTSTVYSVKTPKSQSTGDFEKADTSGMDYLGNIPAAISGKGFVVKVTVNSAGVSTAKVETEA